MIRRAAATFAGVYTATLVLYGAVAIILHNRMHRTGRWARDGGN